MSTRNVYLAIGPGIRGRLMRLARGNMDRAEELEQRVLVRVWETSSRRREEIRSPAAYGHGVLMRIHQEYLREEKRHRHADIDALEVRSQRTEDPADAAERHELFRLVNRAISKLTDTTRMVVRMRYFEDLQQRQIARRMHIGEVKVCRILKRARERLRGLLH